MTFDKTWCCILYDICTWIFMLSFKHFTVNGKQFNIDCLPFYKSWTLKYKLYFWFWICFKSWIETCNFLQNVNNAFAWPINHIYSHSAHSINKRISIEKFIIKYFSFENIHFISTHTLKNKNIVVFRFIFVCLHILITTLNITKYFDLKFYLNWNSFETKWWFLGFWQHWWVH